MRLERYGNEKSNLSYEKQRYRIMARMGLWGLGMLILYVYCSKCKKLSTNYHNPICAYCGQVMVGLGK